MGSGDDRQMQGAKGKSMLLTNAGGKEKEYVTDKCRGQRERVSY